MTLVPVCLYADWAVMEELKISAGLLKYSTRNSLCEPEHTHNFYTICDI